MNGLYEKVTLWNGPKISPLFLRIVGSFLFQGKNLTAGFQHTKNISLKKEKTLKPNLNLFKHFSLYISRSFWCYFLLIVLFWYSVHGLLHLFPYIGILLVKDSLKTKLTFSNFITRLKWVLSYFHSIHWKVIMLDGM